MVGSVTEWLLSNLSETLGLIPQIIKKLNVRQGVLPTTSAVGVGNNEGLTFKAPACAGRWETSRGQGFES